MKKTTQVMLTSVLALGVASQLAPVRALAASATGTARQVVIAALSISNTSDLDFGTAAAGDAAKTVAPGSSENSENGSFAVSGAPNLSYTISLPADGAVSLTTGAGSPNETISVNSFLSSPAAGANGLLNASGSQNLFVGATRSALLPSQVAGTYTGTYTVTVVY